MVVYEIVEPRSGDYIEVDEATFVQDLVDVVSRHGGFGATHYCQILSDRYLDLTVGEVKRVLKHHSVFRNRGGRGQPAWYVRGGLVLAVPRQRGPEVSERLPFPVVNEDAMDSGARPRSRKIKHLEFMLECAQEQLRDAADERAHLLDETARLKAQSRDDRLTIQDLEDDISWLQQVNDNLLYELHRRDVTPAPDEHTTQQSELMARQLSEQSAALADATERCAAAIVAREETLRELETLSQHCVSIEDQTQEQTKRISALVRERDFATARTREIEREVRNQQRSGPVGPVASADLERQLLYYMARAAELEEQIDPTSGSMGSAP